MWEFLLILPCKAAVARLELRELPLSPMKAEESEELDEELHCTISLFLPIASVSFVYTRTPGVDCLEAGTARMSAHEGEESLLTVYEPTA